MQNPFSLKNILTVSTVAIAVSLSACSSRSLTPDTEELKVRRESPSDKCKSLGAVTGSTISAKGKPEDALEDMKKISVAKAANYLWVKQYSDNGTSVTGEAFNCP